MAKRKRSSRFSLLPKRKTDVALMEDITDEDKNLAREVWMQVEGNFIVISKALFSELFKRHPEYKEFFKDLIDVNATEEDAWLNLRFERHMIHMLLPTLGTIVRNVDRPETTREQMIKLGKVHKVKNIGLKRKHIETLKAILLETVKKTLGGGIRDDHETALEKIFSAAFCIFEDALEGKLSEKRFHSYSSLFLRKPKRMNLNFHTVVSFML